MTEELPKAKVFCKKNALTCKHLELNSFMVTGLNDALLRLTGQLYIRDWHWDVGGKVLEAQGQAKKDDSHSQGKHR